MQVERPLRIDLDRRELTTGETVTVLVRDAMGRRVKDAHVVAGATRTRTDETGRCQLTLQTPGFWKCYAFKRPSNRIRYYPRTALVRVLPGSSGPLTPAGVPTELG